MKSIHFYLHKPFRVKGKAHPASLKPSVKKSDTIGRGCLLNLILKPMDDLEKLLEFESEEEKENFNESLKCKHHPCFNGGELYCDYPNCETYEVKSEPEKQQ